MCWKKWHSGFMNMIFSLIAKFSNVFTAEKCPKHIDDSSLLFPCYSSSLSSAGLESAHFRFKMFFFNLWLFLYSNTHLKYVNDIQHQSDSLEAGREKFTGLGRQNYTWVLPHNKTRATNFEMCNVYSWGSTHPSQADTSLILNLDASLYLFMIPSLMCQFISLISLTPNCVRYFVLFLREPQSDILNNSYCWQLSQIITSTSAWTFWTRCF